MKSIITTFFILLLMLTSGCADKQEVSEGTDRMDWWRDARFGMFIHWGVYSGAEGIWKGEKLRNDNDYVHTSPFPLL